MGESQSAAFLTTYVNVVDPLAHGVRRLPGASRFGPAAPLDGTAIFEETDAICQPVPFRPICAFRSSR